MLMNDESSLLSEQRLFKSSSARLFITNTGIAGTMGFGGGFSLIYATDNKQM